MGDLQIQAYGLNALGWCFLKQHRYSEAAKYLDAGLPFARALEVKRHEAVIEGNLSLCNTGLGHYERAVAHAERSLTHHQSRGDQAGEALALHQSAMAWQGIGDHEKAAELCEKSLHIGRDFGHPPEMAATLDTLGAVSLSLGHPDRAAAHWRAALAIFEEYGDHRTGDLRERLQGLETGKAGSS